ncbi:Thiol-disulfide isomerase or thioredoxin [Salinihabitans flavidus]|uniref:Thiol-disulfide isomerase or thioredoxin n=1 Tax=Salinihabitans flavidus TaxID=569882 RepID=A0A1H8SW89_9RHOB|nr:TlpA disulfide reductase family protein [Salinihabitans flavidus]SEO82618.1 Thiol-disulfide isomerase or thioredoxin [Salinihabitans flavidus]
MKRIWSALVYTALSIVAIAATVAPLHAADPAALEALREGDMRKLNFHSTPREVSTDSFETEDGPMTLADYKGKIVLLNFWATWCAPCRKEMPMLSDLQSEFGGEEFEVVTLATGRNLLPAMKKFLSEIGAENLPLHRDPNMTVARGMGVFGLPVTVILNRDGQEIARLQGDADWNSQSTRDILTALIDGEA